MHRHCQLISSLALCLVLLSVVACQLEEEIGAPDKYTLEERQALEKFRELMKDELYKEHMLTDKYLIRWLKAKKLDIPAAVQMLRKSLEWRKSNRIDDIDKENFTLFEKQFPFTIDGKDRVGRPLGICLTGRQDVRKALVAGEREKFLRYYAYRSELLDRLIRNDENVTNCTLILDLNGFNLRQHACIACLPIYFEFVSMYENHYPGILHRLYILNTPGIFQPVRQFLRQFLSGTTRSVIRVHGYDKREWQDSLLQDIAPDQLPASLGGTRII